MRIFSFPDNLIHFLVCGKLMSDDGFVHMRRTFSDNVLIFVLKGTLYINSNKKEYCVGPNQFIFLRGGEEHFGSRSSIGELEYFWVHFKNELSNCPELIYCNQSVSISSGQKTLSPVLPGKGIIIPEYGTLLQANRFLLMFRQLMDFSMEEDFYNKNILDYLCSALFMEFSNQYLQVQNKEKKMNPLVFEVCNWIRSNFTRQFTVEDLCQAQGYQSDYLAGLFKKTMGISLLQYTNQLRIENAKKLLPNFSVKETAFSCGFEDEKYFMKVFKKSQGITPKEFKSAFFKQNIN